MDKRYNDLSAAMREVARQRDKRLRDDGATISPHRLQRLHVVLTSEFPVETAFQAAAAARDNSLEELLVLPRRSQLFLRSRLLAQRTRWLRSGAPQRLSASVQTFFAAFRSATRFAAATVLIVVTIGALHFASSGRNDGPGPVFQNAPHSDTAIKSGVKHFYQDRRETGFLRKPSNDLTLLRVGRIELASLKPSLLTINRALLVDRHDFDRGLSLDLPIRQMLADGDTTASP